MNSMTGKVCIITGSNSGIGKETAASLAEKGATIAMAVRNTKRGEAARTELEERTGSESISVMLCDLASIDSIRTFVSDFNEKYNQLDVLVNNAGAAFHKRHVTHDGFECTLAVNFLGPFLLTHCLLPKLKACAPSRIINLTSGLHGRATVDFNDLQSERSYNGMSAYQNTKLMSLMFTYELARRLEGTGVTANAVHPGFVATNLGSNMGGLRNKVMFKLVRPMQISPQKGAATSVYVASSPELENVSGAFFAKEQETKSSDFSYDREVQKRLWETAEKLLRLDTVI
ncbi:MAG: SDR family oxidoreductase [Candidatus Hodarchaeota archaeon]